MKVYEKTKDGMLMHSDVYLGLDYTSNNLKHYKYLRRERVGGRWVYYYKDPTEKLGDQLNKSWNEGNEISKRIEKKSGYNSIKKNKDFKKWAAKHEKIRAKYNRANNGLSGAIESVKRGLAHDMVKPLNEMSKAKQKGKKYLKKLFNW